MYQPRVSYGPNGKLDIGKTLQSLTVEFEYQVLFSREPKDCQKIEDAFRFQKRKGQV